MRILHYNQSMLRLRLLVRVGMCCTRYWSERSTDEQRLEWVDACEGGRRNGPAETGLRAGGGVRLRRVVLRLRGDSGEHRE
jgi:hypothetical protein